jgi:phage repressor protein C with HTH and peptisase S24 domain
MKTIGRRLKDVRGVLKIRNQEEMATMLGANSDTIAEIETGKTPPSDDFLQRMEKRLRVSGHWLMTGEGPLLLKYSKPDEDTGNTEKIDRDGTSEDSSPKTLDQDEGPKMSEEEKTKGEKEQTLHEDSKMIPSLQFQQLPVVTFKVAANMESFSTAQLDSKQPYITISKNADHMRTDLVAVRVVGTNMEPTIKDGAIACIDRDDKAIVPKDIYAVHNGQGKGAIRRLTVVPGGLVLLSDNREYEFETLELSSRQEPEEFIIGKVVWIWQSFV